jgi:cytochrome c-type biogenesis protein CcmH
MTTFILIAIVLTIVAVAVVIVPLLRKSSSVPTPAVWAAFGAAGVLVFGGGGLYLSWSNWNWKQASTASDVTPENMVSRLARRLEKNPDDLEGWLRLGHSYTVLEQYPLAIRAYQNANQLGGGKNAQALLGLGEALVLSDENEMNGRGAKFIEEALALDPKNGAALFYGAAIAVRRGELPLARQRFSGLLALDPTDDVRRIIERQIASIDEKLAQGGTPTPSGAPPAGGSATAGGGASPDGGNSMAAASVPPVRVRVTLSPKLSGQAPASSPLFVIVRDPRAAGPPLAVKRLRATFPQTVELTTQDSMLPGHTFTKGQLVEVVARVSKSGRPVESPGDPFGLAAHKVGEGGVVDIQIDHVSP